MEASSAEGAGLSSTPPSTSSLSTPNARPQWSDMEWPGAGEMSGCESMSMAAEAAAWAVAWAALSSVVCSRYLQRADREDT